MNKKEDVIAKRISLLAWEIVQLISDIELEIEPSIYKDCHSLSNQAEEIMKKTEELQQQDIYEKPLAYNRLCSVKKWK